MAMSIKNIKRPIILRRMILKSQQTNKIPIRPEVCHNRKVLKVATIPLYREDVIFESKGETFLPGEFRSVTIVNKLNNLTSNSKTIAKYVTHIGEIVEKTSDTLTQLIGQEAYNTLFYALCSVINQEYRIKGILALLTTTKKKEVPFKIPLAIQMKCKAIDKACQTDETRLAKQIKVRRRVRKILGPYVVKPDTVEPIVPVSGTEELSKLIQNQIEVETNEEEVKFKPFNEAFKTEPEDTNSETTSESRKTLPDLGFLQDDNSYDSVRTFSTLHSFNTFSDLLINPISLVDNVDRHTKENQIILPNHTIMLMDGTELKLPFKPEDNFHIATKENLLFLDEVNRKKLLLHQMQIDYKYCWSFKDEDGNLLIHLAVMNDDIELLKRQCVVLKIRNQSVDILADNGLTALKLSLFRENASATSVLLQHGADPFLADDEHSTCAHVAAELKTDHLSIILNHCKLNAREIISQHVEELQKPGWEEKSDKELSNLLINYMCCTLFDKQGYNLLMLASKLGHYENVRLLLEAASSAVDLPMPNCGNTALYLAVSAACTVAAERGNRSKMIDHFRKTIEILVEYGADPSIDNCSGSNVNLLLQEFNCAELSMLIANKVTCTKYFEGQMDPTKNFDSYHLINDGNKITITEMDKNDKKSALKRFRKEKVAQPLKTTIKEEQVDNTPVKNKQVDNISVKDKQVDNITVKDNQVDKIPVKKEQVEKIFGINENQCLKPIIVENILIKSPLKLPEKQNMIKIITDNSKSIDNKSVGTVNSKEFVIKPLVKETVSNVKKTIWYTKRRAVEVKTEAKRIKTKK